MLLPNRTQQAKAKTDTSASSCALTLTPGTSAPTTYFKGPAAALPPRPRPITGRVVSETVSEDEPDLGSKAQNIASEPVSVCRLPEIYGNNELSGSSLERAREKAKASRREGRGPRSGLGGRGAGG